MAGHPSCISRYAVGTMEIELKLLLDASGHARIRDALSACLRTLRQRNHYFDDAKRSLARAGWGLRLREETGPAGTSTQLTLKHSGDSTGEFAHRAEYEREVTAAEFARFLASPSELLLAARALLPEPDLVPTVGVHEIGCTDNRRDVYGLPGAPGLWIELDHTIWPDRTESFELELELEAVEQEVAARQRLKDLLLRAGVEWRVGQESKLARLMRILDPDS
jgi:inorganic triphosphatase YgiF